MVWVGSSQKNLEEFPDAVKETMLFALDLAKVGGKHGKAKPFKGFSGSSVLEIVQKGKDSTFRTLYTVEFKEAVFVLHCFKKKSTEGIKTPKKEVDLIHHRYKQSINLHKKLFKNGGK